MSADLPALTVETNVDALATLLPDLGRYWVRRLADAGYTPDTLRAATAADLADIWLVGRAGVAAITEAARSAGITIPAGTDPRYARVTLTVPSPSETRIVGVQLWDAAEGGEPIPSEVVDVAALVAERDRLRKLLAEALVGWEYCADMNSADRDRIGEMRHEAGL